MPEPRWCPGTHARTSTLSLSDTRSVHSTSGVATPLRAARTSARASCSTARSVSRTCSEPIGSRNATNRQARYSQSASPRSRSATRTWSVAPSSVSTRNELLLRPIGSIERISRPSSARRRGEDRRVGESAGGTEHEVDRRPDHPADARSRRSRRLGSAPRHRRGRPRSAPRAATSSGGRSGRDTGLATVAIAAATATWVAGNDSPGVTAPCRTTPETRSSGRALRDDPVKDLRDEPCREAAQQRPAPPGRGRRPSTHTTATTGTAASAPNCITPTSGAPAGSGSWLISRNRLISARLGSVDPAAIAAQPRSTRPSARRNTSLGWRRVVVRTGAVDRLVDTTSDDPAITSPSTVRDGNHDKTDCEVPEPGADRPYHFGDDHNCACRNSTLTPIH